MTALLAAKNDVVQPGEKKSIEEPTAMLSPMIIGSPPPVAAVHTAASGPVPSPAAVDTLKNEYSGGPSTLAADPSFVALPRQIDDFPAGLRGLNNMGHTCFMNSILQALLHTPLLLEHHLAHGHSCGSCNVDGTSNSSMHHHIIDGGNDPCLACELDRVFSEAYSGNRVPLSPASFLHAWWSMAGGDLGGGCKQQDAHEFFLFMLQMISSVNGSDTTTNSEGILSKLFDGSIRSDVVCCACCAASTTIDHFTNLSLDIPPPTRLLPPPIVPRPKAQATNGKSGTGAVLAKAGKQLVGAAKAAHLAKLSRQNSGKGVAALMQQQNEPTPELSSQLIVDLTMDESMASELTSGGGGGGTGAEATPTSQVKNKNVFRGRGGVANAIADPARPSPPTEAMTVAQPEQGSGINALGAAVVGADGGGDDTLSSPQRKRTAAAAAGAGGNKSASLPPRSSSSPSADGIDPQQIQAAAAVAAAAAGPGGLAHPALAQYLHWPGESLIGCLRRFVWPEQLGATGRWRCSECGSQDGAIKQLSLARLPPILVLHAKRFEHTGGTRATAKKLDTYLSFPLEDLDMAPYLTAEALKSRHVARPTPPPPGGIGGGSGTAAAADKNVSTPAPVLFTDGAAGGSRGARSRPVSNVAAGDSTVRRTRSAATTAAAAAATGIEKSTGGGGGGGRTRSTAMTRSFSAAAATGNANIDAINSGDAANTSNFLPSPSSTALPSTATAAQTSTSMYDLFAVVCHRGTFQGGHYVSYIRASDGKWYLCDDAYVQRVSEEVVRTSQAYMLFYGQKGLLPWNSTRAVAR